MKKTCTVRLYFAVENRSEPPKTNKQHGKEAREKQHDSRKQYDHREQAKAYS